MSHRLDYAEHPPTPALAPYVRCFWTLAGPAPAVRAPQPVVPDGCMEIILNFGDHFERHRIDGTFVERQPLELLVGPSTGPAVIVPMGRVDLLGVRVHPWGAGVLFGIPPVVFRDELLPMRDASRELARSIEPVRGLHTPRERLLRLVTTLETRVKRAEAPDTAVRAVVRMLEVRDPMPSLRALSARVGHSARWIQRRFESEVGLSPKMLARIFRTQRALRIADRFPERSWSTVAADAGFFDHSHLVRDFRQLVGCPPTELRARGGELTEVFLERSSER